MATKYKPWTPYSTPLPPAGSYDPSLDAALGATQRGLGDLQASTGLQDARSLTDWGAQLGQYDQQRTYLGQDVNTQRDALNLQQQRGTQDLGTQRTQLGTDWGRTQQDLNTGFSRGNQDLQTGYDRGIFSIDRTGSRAEQDYQRNVQMLTKQYGALGRSQTAAANQRGVLNGTLALQSAARRQSHQADDQQGLDTQIGRTREDLATSRGYLTQDFGTNKSRLGEDYNTNLTRGGQDYQTALTGLNTSQSRLNEDFNIANQGLTTQEQRGLTDINFNQSQGQTAYDRGIQDRTIGLQIGQREAQKFGEATADQKAAQAAASGWNPATKPVNQFTTPQGQPYKLQQQGNMMVAIDPSGKVLWRRPKVGR